MGRIYPKIIISFKFSDQTFASLVVVFFSKNISDELMLSILTVLWAAVERIASLSSLLLTKGDPQFTTIFSFPCESSKDKELA